MRLVRPGGYAGRPDELNLNAISQFERVVSLLVDRALPNFPSNPAQRG